MLAGLDHLVILVEELEEAVAGYEELGFRVTPGGEHADGLTSNALIPFADGTYLELVAFIDPAGERDNVWGWRPFLETGGGLVDYCVVSSDLIADTRRLEEAGFGVEGPDEGGRRLPGGEEIRWKTARVRQEGRMLPFLIEDETPRASRVPTGPATEHPNGVTGISQLQVSARDGEKALESLAAFTDDRSARGDAFRIGPHALAMVTPDDPDDDVEWRLETSGPGPFAVELTAPGGGRRMLDPGLAQGARIRLG